MILSLAAILCLSSEVLSVSLVKESLSSYSLATCNDGTPGAYFHTQNSSSVSSGKFLIFLPNGGDCSSVKECEQRCSSGSQCTAPKSQLLLKDDAGIWGPGKDNPFADYFKVSVHYCSSDSFSGTRGASKATGDLVFHGKHILLATLKDLVKRFKLARGGQLVLAGSGSGARGVGLQCDYVREALKAISPGMDVRCLMDGGDLVPWWVTTPSQQCQGTNINRLEDEKFLWGRDDDSSCLAQNENTSNSTDLAHRCGVSSRYWTSLSTPSLLISPQLDAQLFHSNPCAPESSDPAYSTYELAWRRGVVALAETITARVQPEASPLSLFVPSCSSPLLSSSLALEAPLVGLQQQVSLGQVIRTFLKGEYLQAVDPVGAENSLCPAPTSSAPLVTSGCSSLAGCQGRPYSGRTLRRLHPPSYLYPSHYRRSCVLDPWGRSCGARRNQGHISQAKAGVSRKKSLWRKFYMLQHLRQVYKKWKASYAREYHSIPRVPAIKKPVLPVRRPLNPLLTADHDYYDYDYPSLGDYSDYYGLDYGGSDFLDVLGCPGDCSSVGKEAEEVLSDEALAELLGGGCGSSCGNFFDRIVKAARSRKKSSNNGQTQQKLEEEELEDENELTKSLLETELDYEDFETFDGEESIKLVRKPNKSKKSSSR